MSFPPVDWNLGDEAGLAVFEKQWLPTWRISTKPVFLSALITSRAFRVGKRVTQVAHYPLMRH